VFGRPLGFPTPILFPDYILFRDWAFDDKSVAPAFTLGPANPTPPCALSVYPTSNLFLVFTTVKTPGRLDLRLDTVRLGRESAVVAPPTCSTLPGYVHHGYFKSPDDRGPCTTVTILGRWTKWGVHSVARVRAAGLFSSVSLV